MSEIIDYINNNTLHVFVKPRSKETKVVGWDHSKKALVISLKAQPIDGKANLVLLKFLSKQTKMQARIVAGMTSRQKTICFQ